MTGVNHILTGAIIGATVKQPAIALPLALASHYVLDSLPHFGFRNWEERSRYRKYLNIVATYDVIILSIVVYSLISAAPGWLVIACATLAILPDFVWVYRFTIPERWGTRPPQEGIWLTKFHYSIQKFEFKEGIVIEIIATLLLGSLAIKLI